MKRHIQIKIDNANDIQDSLINELLSQGKASFVNNELIIQPELLYWLLPTDRMLLGLPSYYPFTVEITNDVNIYKKESKLKYVFKEYEYGNYLHYERDANLLFEEGKLKYLLSKEHFNVCKLIDRYNLYLGDETGRFRLLARISQLGKENGLLLPPSLRDSKIALVDKLALDFKHDMDGRDIDFELSAVTVSEKAPTVLDLKSVNTASNFAKIKQDNVTHRLYYNNSISKIISNVKKINKLPIEDKIDFISKAESDPDLDIDLDANIIDLSQFSKRVIEYGYYKPKYYPLVKAFKSDWVPGFSVDKGKEQEIVYIKTPKVRAEFEECITQAVGENKDVVAYKNHVIPLAEAEELNVFFKKQLANPEVKQSSKEKKVLIIEENINELKYDENQNDAEISELFFINPPNLKSSITLLEHQKEGIAWLLSISEYYKGCLLADDMGLGKTLQILSFLDILANESEKKEKKFLIIAPISLLENWKNEYSNFFNPSMNIINITSKTNLQKYNDTGLNNTCMLTNYETVRNPKKQLFFGKIQWDAIIIDEAQKIKTPGTRVTNAIKSLKANFKIAMTGTPVENTLLDLWSIVDFTTPGLLGSAKKFKDDFDKPLQNDFSQENLFLIGSTLRRSLGNSFKRRLKKDTKELGLPKKYIDVRKYKMPEIQRDIYMEEISLKEDNVPMLSIIQNLRNISDHPYLKYYDINDFTTEELINASAKLRGTINILSEIKERKEKVIIFSEFRKLQYMLKNILKDYFSLSEIFIINGLTATQQTSYKESRQSIINKFSQLQDFQIIIMSPIAAGVGLNITTANNVIHYTRHWNPAKESQATDRVYRIGQNKQVNIYYPMSILPDYKSFDLILDELLSKKIQLSDYTMFPTPISEVKLDDFKNVFNISTQSSKTKLHKHEITKLENIYLQSLIAKLLQKRFCKVYLTPEKNNKGIDIVGIAESKTELNYLIKIIYPKQEIYHNIEEELLTLKKYFDFTFNTKFELLIVTTKKIVPYTKIEVIELEDLLQILEEEDVSIKQLEKVNQSRMLNFSELELKGNASNNTRLS